MIRVTFQVSDVKAGLMALHTIPEEMRRKVFRKALRAGSRVLVSGMRRGLRRHFRTGTLSKSIKTKAKYYAKGDVMVVVVGVSSDPSANGTFRGSRITPYRYSHFVTNPRRGFMQECPRKSGRFRWIGPNTPDDYVTKATVTGRSEVIAAMQKVIYDSVR